MSYYKLTEENYKDYEVVKVCPVCLSGYINLSPDRNGYTTPFYFCLACGKVDELKKKTIPDIGIIKQIEAMQAELAELIEKNKMKKSNQHLNRYELMDFD